MIAQDLPPSMPVLARLYAGLNRIDGPQFVSVGVDPGEYLGGDEWMEFAADPLGYCVSPERPPGRGEALIELAWKLGQVQ